MLDGQTIGPLVDPQLEEALIALVFDGGIGNVSALDPEDIANPQLSAIFAAALDVHAEGGVVNTVTMLPRLRGIFSEDGTPGLDIVKRLTLWERAPSIEDVAARLRGLAERRRMREYLAAMADAVIDEAMAVPALAKDASAHLLTFRGALTAADDAKHIHDLAEDFLEFLQSKSEPTEITTGFASLDEKTGGWHRGQFAILAGRPSMGKSTVALSSLLKTAQKGHGVLFFSLEMTPQQLVARALTDLAYTTPALHYADLKPQRVTPSQIERLRDAAAKLKGLPIEIEPRGGLNAAEILDRAKQSAEAFQKIGKTLDLVVVDHMLKIAPSGRYEGQPVKELDEISQAMCDMAKSLNVAVVGLHQLNRNTEGRDNQRALLSDLRGSGTLEQDADVVLFCYRPAYRFERLSEDESKEFGGEAARQAAIDELQFDLELQIAKQRQGPTDKIDLWCDIKAGAVRDLEWRR